MLLHYDFLLQVKISRCVLEIDENSQTEPKVFVGGAFKSTIYNPALLYIRSITLLFPFVKKNH